MSAVAKELRLALIDSRPLVRAAIGYLLETSLSRLSPGFEVRPFASPADFLAQCGTPDIDVVLFNIGAALVRDQMVRDEVLQLRSYRADLPIILLCDHADVSHGVEAVNQGVNGYIPTMLSPAVAVQAICLVHAGGTFLPVDVVIDGLADSRKAFTAPMGCADLAAFTGREREVLTLMWQGKSNKVIARDLAVCESTIKAHVRQIMKKLGANNRTHAIFLLSRSLAQPG